MTPPTNDRTALAFKAIQRDLSAIRGNAWTPSEPLVSQVIDKFLQSEPTWLGEAVRRDPALVDKKDQERITKGQPVPEDIVKQATPQLKLYQGLHAVAFHRHAHAYYEDYRKKQKEAAEPMAAGDAQKLRDGAANDLLIARAI